MHPIARFVDVRVSLGGRPVLAGIDLVVSPGESVGVVGPNGSGKTTLVRALATLTPITTGIGQVLDQDVTEGDLRRARKEIGLIGHQPSLIQELTLAENLHHVARLAGMDSSRVEHALEVVGLADAAGRRVSASSFGMQRRIEIAHLLLRRPRLLLLDEATSGLDSSARALLEALQASVTDRRGAAVIVSHDRSHLDSLCQRVEKLESGRLVPA